MYQQSNILMIDMGAGTTDLVYCEYTPGNTNSAEVLLSWPSKDTSDYFGGREIDELLTEYCIDYLNSYGYDYSKRRHLLERNVKRWKEGELSKVLNKNKKLPGKPSFIAPIINSSENFEFKVSSRSSFEELLEEYLTVFPKMINDCHNELKRISKHDLYRDTDLIILTGGNSQWYFINEYLLGLRSEEVVFDKVNKNRILAMARPQETVAFGLSLNENVLFNSVESINEEENIDVSASKLWDKNYNKIVQMHAFGSAAAGAASGWIPGAGSIAALGISAGFIYGMYINLSKYLNIKWSKNGIKIVSSVILANIASSAAVYLGTSAAISFIPGIGSAGAIAITSGLNYAAVNLAAAIYGSMMGVLFNSKKNISDLSDVQLKELVKKEMEKN